MGDERLTSNPAVELRAVSKRYGGCLVLDDVNLALARGEFFALVGPSGSGKSTLLRMISGMDTPDAGEIWLEGVNVTGQAAHRRPVHTVFQNYALFPHLDVAGNVAFPLAVAGVSRPERAARVRRALSWVKLEDLASRRIDQLSGGQQQRVALARALVKEPSCVLLDEPLAALDIHLRGHTLAFLQELQSRLAVTYLYVTHDRDEALRAAHRIGVLRAGRLEQVGAPEEVYHRPKTAFVAEFMGPINWLPGVIASQNGTPGIRLYQGSWTPAAATGLPENRAVKLGIRPADIRLAQDGWLAARVTAREFRGDSRLLKVSAGEQPVHVEIRADEAAPGIGEEVRLTWPAAAAHIFAGAEMA